MVTSSRDVCSRDVAISRWKVGARNGGRTLSSQEVTVRGWDVPTSQRGLDVSTLKVAISNQGAITSSKSVCLLSIVGLSPILNHLNNPTSDTSCDLKESPNLPISL